MSDCIYLRGSLKYWLYFSKTKWLHFRVFYINHILCWQPKREDDVQSITKESIDKANEQKQPNPIKWVNSIEKIGWARALLSNNTCCIIFTQWQFHFGYNLGKFRWLNLWEKLNRQFRKMQVLCVYVINNSCTIATFCLTHLLLVNCTDKRLMTKDWWRQYKLFLFY